MDRFGLVGAGVVVDGLICFLVDPLTGRRIRTLAPPANGKRIVSGRRGMAADSEQTTKQRRRRRLEVARRDFILVVG